MMLALCVPDEQRTVLLFCGEAVLQLHGICCDPGPELRKEARSRKVDKSGTVLPFEGSVVLSYRHSWIIGTVFDEIEWSTLPITPYRGRETRPIREVIGTVELTFPETGLHLSTLRLHGPFLNSGPGSPFLCVR